MKADRRAQRSERGRRGRLDGRSAEAVAAMLLMLKGYQILGFRLRTKDAEIDILARRGRNLVIVEVKRRPTLDEALAALDTDQRERLWRAGLSLASKRSSLRQLALRLDLIALAPGRFPRHVSNVFEDRKALNGPRNWERRLRR